MICKTLRCRCDLNQFLAASGSNYLPNVFNNLFDNAIKYCKTTPSLIVRTVRENGGVAIEVEDNGIGREAYAKAGNNALTSHKSHGLKVTEERFQILNQVYNVDASVKILDLVTPDHRPAGTQVTLRMKTKMS